MSTETNKDSDFLSLSKPRLSLGRFSFYFISLAALIIIALKFSEISLLKEVFLKANIYWLAGIIITQTLSYYSLALNYRDVLRVKDLEINVHRLFPVTFVIQFLNQALPSATLSGQAFFIQYLKKYGLTVAEGIGRAIVELMSLFIAFGVFFLISAILMFHNGALADQPKIGFLIYLFLFFGASFSIIFFMLQNRKGGGFTKWVIRHLHKYFEKNHKKDPSEHVTMLFEELRANANIGHLGKHKKAFFAAVFWQGGVLFLNVISLFLISYAIDYPISFSVAFITFTLTKFVSMVAFIPGAFGVFEGGMTLILVSFGISASIAFAVTLIFRAFTFWFPMPIGWILFRRIFHRQEL